MRRLPDPLVRRAYRVAYVLLRAYSRVRRPHTRGVKCLLVAGEELLLVRHAYGPGDWDLPGGFCRRGESFAAAARREVCEELGVRAGRWTDLGELRRRFHGRHETLHGFRADLERAGMGEVAIESAEVAELAWFRRDALPEPLAPIVRAILALDDGWRGGLSVGGRG